MIDKINEGMLELKSFVSHSEVDSYLRDQTIIVLSHVKESIRTIVSMQLKYKFASSTSSRWKIHTKNCWKRSAYLLILFRAILLTSIAISKRFSRI